MKYVVPFVVVTLLVAAGTLWAKPFGKEGPKKMLKEMVVELELTTEQKSKLANMLKEKMERNSAMRDKMMSARAALMDAVSSGDTEATRAASREMAPIKEAMAVERAKFMRDFQAILTPAQQAKFTEKKFERRKKMTERRKFAESNFGKWIDANL